MSNNTFRFLEVSLVTMRNSILAIHGSSIISANLTMNLISSMQFSELYVSSSLFSEIFMN